MAGICLLGISLCVSAHKINQVSSTFFTRHQSTAEWLTNINFSFPPPPPPPPPRHNTNATPNEIQEPPLDPRQKRFHLHGDLIHDDRFPDLYRITIPPKPPIKYPRYEDAWISHLLTGPYLPLEWRREADIVPPPDNEKLLLFLERAKGHKHDLIAELVVRGEWAIAVWIVRQLIQPGFEYPEVVEMYSIFDEIRGSTMTDGDYDVGRAEKEYSGGIPSPAIAGRSGLWALRDKKVKWDIERRRRGYGVVLYSLAGMVIRAGTESRDRGHKDLMATVRQILAYMHTVGFMPDSLYDLGRHPRLYLLRSRILASLADAMWRAQEAMAAEEAERLGIVGEYRGFEVPRARHRFEVWGGGTKDIPPPPPSPPAHIHRNDTPQWGSYSEREVWLELILTIVVETGYGNVGVDVVRHAASTGWSFLDYRELYPNEYTSKALLYTTPEPKAGPWQLEGHSLDRPPVTTHPLSLPDTLLPGVVDAVVDSTAEGRGLESMFITILSYAKSLPMKRTTLLRLLRHPALLWSKNAEVMEAGATILLEFLDGVKACNMFYTALNLHISNQNLPGAQRVWAILRNRTLNIQQIPDPLIASYLMFLVGHRKLGYAFQLVNATTVDGETFPPVIQNSAYNSSYFAPPLLALAVASLSEPLFDRVRTALALTDPRRITRSTYTSLLKANLAFGDFTAAKEVLIALSTYGHTIDGVLVGVLVNHELERDRAAGYAFVESSAGVIPFDPKNPGRRPKNRNRKQATAGKMHISRDAWVSVLREAVVTRDVPRTKWAMMNMGIDLETGAGLDTLAFNVLLMGVAQGQGCVKAMEMCHKHHTRGSKRPDGAVIGNGISFRTVIHCAVKEMIALDLEQEKDDWVPGKWWDPMWGKQPKQKLNKKEERKDKAEKAGRRGTRQTRRRRIEFVLDWCWSEVRRSGMGIKDVEKTIRIWLEKGKWRGFLE
ncbi:hypothetical protein DFP73DRAFT_612922 [Morchella snyderi]|nr:hypothetical protein DFP73DRAFT_612922 [Morchella snyderi]